MTRSGFEERRRVREERRRRNDVDRRDPRLARASITTTPGSEHHERSAKGAGGRGRTNPAARRLVRRYGDLRFFPAVAGALVVVLAGLMARELGGGCFAQGLAALAALVAPNFLVMGTFISMDAFDQLFWVSAFVLILILKQDRPRLWLLFGLIAGLGVLTKITMLYFGLAVFVALLLTPARRYLFTPWPAGMDRRPYMEEARPR